MAPGTAVPTSPGCDTGTGTGCFLLSLGSLLSTAKKETQRWLCSDATQEDKCLSLRVGDLKENGIYLKEAMFSEKRQWELSTYYNLAEGWGKGSW